MRVGTAFWEKYKHYKGTSKYFKKVRKFQAKNTYKNKKYSRLNFGNC